MDLQIPAHPHVNTSTPWRRWLPALVAGLGLVASVLLMSWSNGDPADTDVPVRAGPVEAGPDYATGAF